MKKPELASHPRPVYTTEERKEDPIKSGEQASEFRRQHGDCVEETRRSNEGNVLTTARVSVDREVDWVRAALKAEKISPEQAAAAEKIIQHMHTVLKSSVRSCLDRDPAGGSNSDGMAYQIASNELSKLEHRVEHFAFETFRRVAMLEMRVGVKNSSRNPTWEALLGVMDVAVWLKIGQ